MDKAFQNFMKIATCGKSKRAAKSQQNVLPLQTRFDSCTFSAATKCAIQIAQYLGFFPVNIKGAPYKSLRFKWLHWRVLYTFVTFLLFIWELFMQIYYEIYTHEKQSNTLFTTILVFHIGALMQFILFFKLTLEWPTFVQNWYKVEIRMINYELHCNLRRRINTMVASMLFIAGVEHSLVNAYKLANSLRRESTTYDAFKDYFERSYSHVFEFVEYSVWKGILMQFLNLQRTFIWNFADVFVMIIGSALAFKLKQIANQLQFICRLQVADVNSFKNVRLNYVKLTELCQVINNKMAFTIIVCFAVNIYFILIQLFSSLRRIESPIETAYFYISSGLLAIRIICVCIFGGGVYEEWKNIGVTIVSVQSSVYNEEVQRFASHVVTCELALTGKNFFSISRSLALKIASAVVTYELVLIQFNLANLGND